MITDWLIVGAGFAGATVARCLADMNQRVLVVDRRLHLGGSAHDAYDPHGILVHQYGAHIFHTNSEKVVTFLSRFTDWHLYEHRVRASVQGQLVPFPINLDTINHLYGLNLTTAEAGDWLEARKVHRDQITTAEDAVISKVGDDLYRLFYQGYSRKHWACDPAELNAQVTARIPVRTSRDDRYFDDTYQMLPRHGYHRLFATMLDHPNISILLGEDGREVRKSITPTWGTVVTSPIDEWFDYRFGDLPYRSLTFHAESFPQEAVQPVGTINYPNTHKYIRSTEYKHLTGQVHPWTTVVYEEPVSGGEPLYPIPSPESEALLNRYRELVNDTPGLWVAGRLGTYRYYNMDQVVAQSLRLADTLREFMDPTRDPMQS